MDKARMKTLFEKLSKENQAKVTKKLSYYDLEEFKGEKYFSNPRIMIAILVYNAIYNEQFDLSKFNKLFL